MSDKRLVAGEKVKINDYVNTQHYEIHIQIESSMTIDICCFGLDLNKKLSDDRYMVFYNQISSPEGAVKLTVNDQKKTVFLTHPHKLPAAIKSLVFTATIDGNGTMSNINKGHLAFFVDSREILRFDFSGLDFKHERAIIIGEIYFKDVWRFGAVGQGFNGGLSALLKHFGGEEIIDDNSSSVLNSSFKYYYSKLNSSMKKAYEAMVDGINHFSENINISRDGQINVSAISNLVEAVKLDNPEIFYIASDYEYSTIGNEFWYKPKYLFNKTTIQQMQNRLSTQVDTILKDVINRSMDDYEKELVLHDYLVQNIVYDYDGFLSQNSSWEIYSAYGALINKKAVCEGYAKAMKILLDRCAIDCLIVTGDSTIPDSHSSVGHAWNMVKIKHHFYHLDVTWDAPINKSPDELFHYYFNLSDNEILIDHKWNSDVPQCHSNEHNYFTYQGLNVTNDSALLEKLQHTIHHKKPILSFRYTGSNASHINTEKLHSMISNAWKNRGFSSRQLSSGSLNWNVSYNERQKVFKVEFSYG